MEVWVVVVVWEKWCSSMGNMGRVIISRCIMCRGSMITMKSKGEGGAGGSARGGVSTAFWGTILPCACRWCGPGPSAMHRHHRGLKTTCRAQPSAATGGTGGLEVPIDR